MNNSANRFSLKSSRSLATLALVILLLSTPVLSQFAHNHKFDGEDHRTCPVYYFTAAFQVDFALAPVFDQIIQPVLIDIRLIVSPLKLTDYYSQFIQRAPPLS